MNRKVHFGENTIHPISPRRSSSLSSLQTHSLPTPSSPTPFRFDYPFPNTLWIYSMEFHWNYPLYDRPVLLSCFFRDREYTSRPSTIPEHTPLFFFDKSVTSDTQTLFVTFPTPRCWSREELVIGSIEPIEQEETHVIKKEEIVRYHERLESMFTSTFKFRFLKVTLALECR